MGIKLSTPSDSYVNIEFGKAGTISFNGIQIPLTVSTDEFASLSGTTSGTFSYVEYEVLGVKIFIGRFFNYSNTSGTAQTVTFPIAFTSTPFLLDSKESLTYIFNTEGVQSAGYALGGEGGGITTLTDAVGTLVSTASFPVSASSGVTASTTVLTIPAPTINVAHGTMIAIGN